MALEDDLQRFLARPPITSDQEVTAVGTSALSSLKQTCGSKEWIEGSYASADNLSWVDPTSGDLGLTLSPGLQTPKVDEHIPEETRSRPKSTGTAYGQNAKTLDQHQNKQNKRSRTKSIPISPRPQKSRRLQRRSLSADDPTASPSNESQTPSLITGLSTEGSSTHASSPEELTAPIQITPIVHIPSKSRVSAKNVLRTARNILKTYSEPTTTEQISPGPTNASILDIYDYNMFPAVYPDQMLEASPQTLNKSTEPAVCPDDETFAEYAARVFGRDGHIESENQLFSRQLPSFADFISGDDTLPPTTFDFVEGEGQSKSEQVPFFTDDPFEEYTHSQPGFDGAINLDFPSSWGNLPGLEDVGGANP